MKKNLGAALALYPCPVLVIGAMGSTLCAGTQVAFAASAAGNAHRSTE